MVPHVGFLSSKQREEMDDKMSCLGIALLFLFKWRKGSVPRPAFLLVALEMLPWSVLLMKFVALHFHAARCQQEKY